ncbi:putative thioredoxin [Guyanagaster necrorhizus]|uniref:Thioredoxin n=1 Tax=Guyanagaster necrorhizus TaxID=856835 RepID=A0A9P8AQE1_9AGAR|nr:putative thioredoxin [Guyanagaster necrorhizus MCA 3950]KAG7443900.1 putative thioredoxin [Guyanagaster necrorhizus MCA 3950]
MPVEPINSYDDFQKAIKGDKTIVVDFWASWCGPCKAISPIFQQLSEIDDLDVLGFYKVDVDAQTRIAEEMEIRAMPTFAVFKDGKKIQEIVGADPRSLMLMLNSVIP